MSHKDNAEAYRPANDLEPHLTTIFNRGGISLFIGIGEIDKYEDLCRQYGMVHQLEQTPRESEVLINISPDRDALHSYMKDIPF